MSCGRDEHNYRFRALTDIWTGNAKGKHDYLISTGLLGSIRWWFEVLVRGLGGYACDPSQTTCQDQNHCIVCELFGCTGWTRKFRFQVLNTNGNSQLNQIKSGDSFILRFIPLRFICLEEWTILDATLRLIADYGAIGGKTVYKPSDEPGRTSGVQHRDYGLISVCNDNICTCSYDNLMTYLHDSRWRKVDHGKFAWASLDHFWSVKRRYLARQDPSHSTFNNIIGRPEPKTCSSRGDSWLSGRRPNPQYNIEAESKKVFSFKNPSRTFGFVNQGQNIDHDSMRGRLARIWGENSWEYLTGDMIRDRLFSALEDKK